MRLQCLLLLAPCLALVVLGQETAPQATVTTGDAGEQENPNNGTADTKPRMPTEEAILGQMPPITPLRSGVPSLDAFYMLFPALGSLLRWGALFPAPTILGAVPDSLQPTAAASKVVLVLADDPTAKTRVPRQDAPPPTNPFGQFLAQMPNANFAQGLMNPANFNPDNFNLGQMAPNVGQALTNMQLPPMPTMPQFGFENILGAAPPPPPAALPPAPAEPAPPADKPADEPAAPVAAPNPFAFLNPSNFDMNQMLGQAQQSLPPMPSGVDFFSNLRQMWPGAPPASPAPGSEGQASDISEIRVRPEEAAYSQDNDLDEKERVPLLWFRMPMNRQGDEGESKPLEDLRVEAKLRAFERQVIAELKMLQQIERVAKEMRSSAASSSGSSGSSGSGSPYKISYPLSRTPVHKITRADIEQALRDDYVRRLLHKEAQRKSRANHAAFKRQTMPADASMSKEDIVKIMAYAYRMATEQQSAEKNKEDKIYAAYRATGEKPQQQERQMQQQPMMMQQQPMPQMQQRQWEAEKQEAKMQQNPMMMMQQQQRQWEAEQNEAKMQQQRQMMAEQQPMMMQQQRQWEAEQKEAKIQQNPMMMQQRQWEAEQQQQQQRQMMAEHAQMQQQPMMHMQQRMEQQQQQQPMIMMQEPMRMEQQPMIMQQRQMAMEPPQMQQNPMMQMQQRQWEAEQKDAKIQQQRQWEAEQNEAKMQQNPMMIQQQQRQWEAEQNEAKMQQQQRQWEAEKQEAKIQQNPMMMQQRQWEAEKQEAKIQQNPMMMQQRQWEAEKQEAKIQQNPMMMMQQRQMTMDPMQMQQLDSARQWGEPQGDAGEEGEAMLGEAEPQMPEVPGQARHKVDMLGLGGDKRKKSKHGHGSPTVINYYAVQQQQQYPRPQPSYGTSYGGGGYGSNAYGGGGYSSGGYSSGGYSSGGHSSGGYSSGGHSSGGYSSGGYRAALGNDEVDEMLRQHQTMARTINPGNPNGVQQQEQEQQRSSNQTTPQLTPTQRLHKSQSSASTASESESESETESESDPVLGSKYSFKEGILQPYMGLLPISHPNDPWTHKAYDPHHALYTGGGSYAAYLKDNDGRRRRDTHIMPQMPQQRSLLTPDMLERLLRIKIEFQRRFPHLYKTMLSHHTNQTRVEVQPPVLGRKKAAVKEAKPKYESEEGPVYELGAAERGLFEEEEEDQAEAAADPEPNIDIKESQELSNNNNDDDDMDTSGRKEQDDNELDYFNFDDDDDTDNFDD
ncbi:defective chorion-1 protein, FC125 isoform isoform X2 [Drosophila subobscura]|uniref:defective chorion-1 protein, FC125 isoform isoform X2 n=1 Tax=Drosophila subobscura TaxID=7241 RepID=UPI00155A8EDE|nr:defective chorion-1 protein, FC125 isoform isoform X2 [Drosophila subobscura]